LRPPGIPPSIRQPFLEEILKEMVFRKLEVILVLQGENFTPLKAVLKLLKLEDVVSKCLLPSHSQCLIKNCHFLNYKLKIKTHLSF
jgi:hypothetical protein